MGYELFKKVITHMAASNIEEYEKFLHGKYGEITATDFAKILGIGRATLYKYSDIYFGVCMEK